MGAVCSVVKQALALVLALAEKGVFILQGHGDAQQAKQHNKFLWGNFAPVDGDFYAANLPVTEGKLPPELAGMFARNGPNPAYIQADYHWFDGSGYIHAVTLDPVTQTANYSAQYVETSILKQERAANRALMVKFGDMSGPLAVVLLMIEGARKALGIIDASEGAYTANTALLWHNNQLFALCEGDQPYLLHVAEDGRVETARRVHKAGPPDAWFTAHPKSTKYWGSFGKLYAFGYDLQKAPYLTFYQMDEEGREIRSIPLDFKRPCMTHDFWITEHYAIFLEGSLYMAPEDLFKGLSHTAFRFDPNKPTRIGIIPLNATDASETIWVESGLDASFVFHFAAGWETREYEPVPGIRDPGKYSTPAIKLYAQKYDHFELDFDGTFYNASDPKMQQRFTWRDLDARSSHLYEYTIRLGKRPSVKGERLVQRHKDARNWEFPQTHPQKQGSPVQYVYATAFSPLGEGESLVKINLLPRQLHGAEATVQELQLPDQTYVGEAIFIPKDNADAKGQEDDGYLVTFDYSYKTNQSSLVVYDALTMDPTPVCRINLPRRVPWGFHALWVPRRQLDRQLPKGFVPAPLSVDDGEGAGSSAAGRGGEL